MNPFLLTLTVKAAGEATPEIAWERYADLDRWSQWSPQVRDVDAPSRRLRAGLTGHVVGPLGVQVPFTITEVAIRRWTWVVHLPLRGDITLEHTVTATGSGSATSLKMRGPTALVVGYAPLARLALTRLVS